MKDEALRRWERVGAWAAVGGVLFSVGWVVVTTLLRHVTAPTITKKYCDFYEFYAGAEQLALGHGAEEVFAAGTLGYVYPPMLAAVLTWLTPLELRGAATVWTFLNAAELIASVWLSGLIAARLFRSRSHAGWRLWVWSLGLGGLVLTMDKVFSDVKMQQSNQLMLLCFCVAGWGMLLRGAPEVQGESNHRPAERARAGRWHGGLLHDGMWVDVLVGLAIGVGFNIKYLTVIAIPYLLVRGAWRAAACGVAGCIVMAVAPALVIGWERNTDLWRGAIAGLLQADSTEKVTGTGVARLMPMQTFGFSITTAMQKAGLALGNAKLGLAMAAAVGGGVLLLMWGMYRRAGVSLIGWRGLARGAAWDERSRRLLAVEWAGLVIGALAFSPQTNMRHVAMALISATIMLGAAVMLWTGGRQWRRAAIAASAGILMMVLGLILPLANADHSNVFFWHRIGGPSWCMVVGWLMVLWAVLGEWKRRVG